MQRFLGLVLAGLLLLIVAAGFAALALRPPADVPARWAGIQRLAETGVAKGDWPGIMWAQVVPGRIIRTGAVGVADTASGWPMTPDTTMPIGSISKVVVGLAAAAAIEAGALDPDAPLSDYLSLDVAWPDGEPRSFAQLATHTSGIVDTDAGYEAAGYHFGATTHPVPLADFLTDYLTANGALYDAAANFAAFPPGSQYAYSNVGAGLAALAIEEATGREFAGYSADVLAPLALSGGWGHLGPAPEGAATLYATGEAGGFEALPPYGLATWPDGQYTASAVDLAKLLATVMGGGVFEGDALIEPGVIDELTRPRVTGLDRMGAPDDSVGLFWGVETLRVALWRQQLEGHSGGDPGLFTMMYRKPGADTGFVLMMNSVPERTGTILRLVRIVNLLANMPGGS
jgi:CubicO group peptidase (beta-lactamase class C family)